MKPMTFDRSRSVISRRLTWLRHSAAVVCLAVTLAGCGGMMAFREGTSLIGQGQVEDGLGKLEEAVRLEPKNAEYRIALANQRASVVSQLMGRGDGARRQQKFEEAEQHYRRALGIDPHQAMAAQGLRDVQLARRHAKAVAEAETLFARAGEANLVDALEKLRVVLAEDAGHRAAMALKAKIEEVRQRSAVAESRLAASFRRSITLEFRDAPIRSVFDFVAKVSGLNFFYDKEVRADARTSIVIRNSSIEEAVRLLLSMNQLEQKILNDNSVLIYPATPPKLKEYQTLVTRSFYVTNADVKAVANSIKTIVKSKDVVFDERIGLIIVRDTPAAVRMAERIVAAQDVSDPEVMLEVEVLEIKRSRLLDLGIQWPTQVTLTPINPTGGTLTLSDLRNTSFSTTQVGMAGITATARKDDQDGNILANPRIRVKNRERAKILIGDKVPVITTTAGSTGFVSESIAYVDVGIKLDVEPMVHLDDQVGIKINLEVSNLVREITTKSGSQSYQIGTRSAATTLRLQDGETQVLAGLISDEDRSTSNRVPLVGQLPLVGRLFASQRDDSQRTEILLSITPRVVRSIQRPELSVAEFDSGTEANVGVEAVRLKAVVPEGRTGQVPQRATASDTTASQRGAVDLSWLAPTEVKVGQEFSAVLKINASASLRGTPMLFGYDAKVFEVLSIKEGEFFKAGGVATAFSQRVDATQGQALVSVSRNRATQSDSGASGSGELVMLTMRAIAPTSAGTAKLRLLTLSPDAVTPVQLDLPVEHQFTVTP